VGLCEKREVKQTSDENAKRPENAYSAVFHYRKRLFARASAENTVTGIRQPVKMQAARDKYIRAQYYRAPQQGMSSEHVRDQRYQYKDRTDHEADERHQFDRFAITLLRELLLRDRQAGEKPYH